VSCIPCCHSTNKHSGRTHVKGSHRHGVARPADAVHSDHEQCVLRAGPRGGVRRVRGGREQGLPVPAAGVLPHPRRVPPGGLPLPRHPTVLAADVSGAPQRAQTPQHAHTGPCGVQVGMLLPPASDRPRRYVSRVSSSVLPHEQGVPCVWHTLQYRQTPSQARLCECHPHRVIVVMVVIVLVGRAALSSQSIITQMEQQLVCNAIKSSNTIHQLSSILHSFIHPRWWGSSRQSTRSSHRPFFSCYIYVYPIQCMCVLFALTSLSRTYPCNNKTR
jgi:hypothetical protein